MSIRISVEWTNIQKFLKILEGTLTVASFDFGTTSIHTVLYQCYVKIQEGSISYSAMDVECGIPTVLSELLHEYTHSLLRAYYNGFVLDDTLYSWITSSHGFAPHEWAVKQYDALSEISKRNFERSCFDHKTQKTATEEEFKTRIIDAIKRLDYNHA